ncbi:MAG: hypothetical protein JWQ90_8 [Hydrocarboniphaga sp.]|uniref:DUF3592 domain-containing protein n=1 Tax=Hydrocarboniphaga sp. TaxID=2033016 RepID=UPI0026164C03|nr:DUF3592 domain-containing protein [Hydrocarboniphaga sp.]MDB5967558.1 hypothetical protein [Hydrocarboniphaga sp.]
MITWIIALSTIPAALALVIATRLLARAKRSQSWPKVEGTIVESRVVGKGNTHAPRVTYTYAVDGRSYVGRRVAVGWAFSATGDYAARFVAAHAKGSRVAVAVDPGNPSYSVLAAGIQFSHLMAVAICGGCFLAVVFIAISDFGVVR